MKQAIEIEVPESKKAIWENNQITFIDVESHWKSIKTFADAYRYCNNCNKFSKYVHNYKIAAVNTYEEKIAMLRLVIAALTNNEKLSLIKGNLYFPIIQFCNKESISKCLGNKIIGKIKIEEKEYLVMGGNAHYGCRMGIGSVYYDSSYSTNYCSIGLSCVSSREIAEHLSTYFGKLIFEVLYGGSNCDWEWVE